VIFISFNVVLTAVATECSRFYLCSACCKGDSNRFPVFNELPFRPELEVSRTEDFAVQYSLVEKYLLLQVQYTHYLKLEDKIYGEEAKVFIKSCPLNFMLFIPCIVENQLTR
jgi:hypothetical protein